MSVDVPTNLSSLSVKKIDYHLAMDIVVERHYLHRICPCSEAFGLCDAENNVWGVVTYGVPCSSTLLKGICGEDEQHNVYEMNRLWVDDRLPRNAASMLVSKSMRMLDKEIIVSFADTSVGHVGYIYQATNFLYCGLSARFLDPKVKGLESQHHATYAHGMTAQDVRDAYGDAVYYVERPRKHRYVYFNAPKKRRKQLRKKLRYEVLPYPKGSVSHAEQIEPQDPERFHEQLALF